MAISIIHTRRAVVIQYDTNIVQGHSASVSTAKPDDSVTIEKKEVVNQGHAVLYFPDSYKGDCFVEVQGSKGGLDSGTITV